MNEFFLIRSHKARNKIQNNTLKQTKKNTISEANKLLVLRSEV